MTTVTRSIVAAAALSALAAPALAQVRARGSVELEWRGFPATSLTIDQARQDASIVFTADVSVASEDRRHRFSLEPFLRIDSADSERSHADFRTLTYERVWRNLELRAGLRRVFWGVAESRHLVDVINQTDLVENPDGEDKLGQPMVDLAWITNAGTVELFVLTGFRTRPYPGAGGRLRPAIAVAPDRAVFSEDGLRRHLGWAARWSHASGGWDLGLSHFHATARDPRLVPEPASTSDPGVLLVPHYDRIHQTGLDVQWTSGGWLLKLEGMTRTGGPARRAGSVVAGFEYTIGQVLGSAADLGLLAEVLLDSRSTEPFQDDVFVGARLALNDVRGTELLAGAIVDRDSGAAIFSLESSRRLNESWSVAAEGRAFARVPASDPLHGLRRDGYLALRLTRWF